MADGAKYLPCKNPNCKSRGRSHPNCHCYDNISGPEMMSLGVRGYELPGTTKGMSLQGVRGGNARNARSRGRRVMYKANGGIVDHYCELSVPHKEECEFYAGGGSIDQGIAPAPPPIHPAITLGHAAAHHGLLGILKDVGSKKDAIRGAEDYLHSAKRGHDALSSHMNDFFESKNRKDKLRGDESKREQLDSLLKEFQANPQKLLDVGGNIGQHLPGHAAQIGNLAATASDYLNTMRPKETQINPLDEPIPPNENDVQKFGRHLDLANNPNLLIQHTRDGQLLPADLQTVQLLYPELFKSMRSKAAESLIDAKTKKKDIQYHQGVSLGLLLGQPLDGTMTPMGLQAIMKANSGIQSPEQMPMQQKKKSSDRATNVELKQINKVDALAETPIESRQIASKSE